MVTSSDWGAEEEEEDWVLKRLAVVGWKMSSRVLFLVAALEDIAALMGFATALVMSLRAAALGFGAKARMGLAGKLQNPGTAKLIPFCHTVFVSLTFYYRALRT